MYGGGRGSSRARTSRRVPNTVTLALGRVEEERALGWRASRQEESVAPEPGPRSVPHHPAAGGEVEQPVAATQIGVEPLLDRDLHQHAARGVHDALRHAGRPRREQDEERMGEGQALEARRGSAARGEPREVARAVEPRAAQEADPDHVLDGRQAGADLRHPLRERWALPPYQPSRRTGPWARSGRSGRARRARRSRASTRTRRRRARSPPASRRWPRGSWAGCPRPDRPRARRPLAATRRARRPARAAPRTTARGARRSRRQRSARCGVIAAAAGSRRS